MTNKDTVDAGLKFNVNTVKRKLSEYYKLQNITKPTYTGGQTAMTAVLQKVYEMILKESLGRLPGDGKDKSGCKTINGQTVQYAMVLHSGFESYCLSLLRKYDSKQMYQDQLPVSISDMDQLRDQVDDKIVLTCQAQNLVCYLLIKVFSDLAHTCSELLSFSSKKSLNAKCVMSAVSIKFSDDIAHTLKAEIVRAAKIAEEDIEDGEGEPVDTVGSVTVETAATGDDTHEETTAEEDKKGKSGKKTKSTEPEKVEAKTKSTKSAKNTKAAKIDVEDEPEAEVKIESEEEEKTAKPTKTTSTKSTKSTKTVKTTTDKTKTK